MKEKLKILLGFFRGLKTEKIDTYITFSYDEIENWDEEFTIGRQEIQLPRGILKIFEEVIDYMMNSFHKYNNYDESDTWSLFVSIYPFKNTIHFGSECYVVNSENVPYEIDLTSPFKPSGTGDKKTLPQHLLDEINIVFDHELGEDVKTIEYEFDGTYDEVNASDFIIDDISDDIRQKPWANLIDNILKNIVDRWWKENYGAGGTIKIEKNKLIEIEVNFRSADYEQTDMDIKITPDDF